MSAPHNVAHMNIAEVAHAAAMGQITSRDIYDVEFDRQQPTQGLHIAGQPPVHEPPRRTVELIPATEVKMKRVRWLYEHWVPRGSLTLLAGREGLGKSTGACKIAADATRGQLPEYPANTALGAMNVAYLATEDSLEMTVKPRLIAAGADMSKVFFFQVKTETGFNGSLTLPNDTTLLEAALVENDVKLVILDAAKSAMNPKLDGNKDDHIRQLLEPLVALANRNDIAIIGLTHFGKSEGKDSGKLMLGSVAWSQIARSVISVAKDENGTLFFTNSKGNLARRTLSMTATIKDKTVLIDEETGETEEIGRLVWGEETDTKATDLLTTTAPFDEEERTEVQQWLIEYLDTHGPAPRQQVLKAARKDGYTVKRTLQRAFLAIGGIATKQAVPGKPHSALWSLPPKDHEAASQ